VSYSLLKVLDSHSVRIARRALAICDFLCQRAPKPGLFRVYHILANILRLRHLKVCSIRPYICLKSIAKPATSSYLSISSMATSQGEPSAKRQKTDHNPVIGTHNGTFHCDEALAVWLLKRTKTYKDAGAYCHCVDVGCSLRSRVLRGSKNPRSAYA